MTDNMAIGFGIALIWFIWRHFIYPAFKPRQAVQAYVATGKPERPVVKMVERNGSSDANSKAAAVDHEAVQALRGLGFSRRDAVALLLASASSDLTSTTDRVLAALRATAATPAQGERRPS